MPVGSDAKWSGHASGELDVHWSTEYSGTPVYSAECNIDIETDDTAPIVAKKLKTAFNAANGPEYSASLTGANLDTVHFSPPENVVGMTANGAPVTSQGSPVAGMTVQKMEPT